MPQVIAYTYEGDVRCPECTRLRAAVGLLERQPPLSIYTDQHGMTVDLYDREGNYVRPVFSTDEHDFTHCGECRLPLEA